MSANLWDASTASSKVRADGTYLSGKVGELSSKVTGLASLTENQTIHMGASLRNSGAGVLKPFVSYKDAAGNHNWVGFPSWQPTDSWQRFEGTCVVPSGMTIDGVGFNVSGATGDIEVLNPVFCYGSMGITIAIASATLSWSAGILATIRYWQLASPTSATPAAPASSSDLGSWSETEPAVDTTKVLWTCERTVYADGTESWSKASKSTSYEAAKDAKSTATDAADAARQAQADVESTNTELSRTRSGFEASIVTLTRRADDADGQAQDTAKTLADEIETRRSFFRLLEQSGLPTLELGSTSSPAMVHLTNEQLQFLYEQVVVAWMSGNELDIRVARIITQLVVGGFAAIPQSDGNLSIKWVGDG